MSLLAQGVLVLGAVLLQATLLGRLDPALPQPNLVLALVVARAWLRGGRAGLGWALAGGLLLDLTATGPLGAHALALLTAAYVAGALAASFEHPGFAAVAGAAGAAVYGTTLLALADFLGLAQVSASAALPLLAGGALTASALAPICMAVMARLGGRRPVGLPAW